MIFFPFVAFRPILRGQLAVSFRGGYLDIPSFIPETPENERVEPKNRPFEKENHLPSTIIVFQPFIFSGPLATSCPCSSLKIRTPYLERPVRTTGGGVWQAGISGINRP